MKITPQMAEQAALIVQAFKEGREVLERVRNDYAREPTDKVILLGMDDQYTYELAPKEPALCWRNEYRGSDGTARFGDAAYGSKADAMSMTGSNLIRTVKFVEASESP